MATKVTKSGGSGVPLRNADPFPKHVAPQLAKLVKHPPASDDWQHEIKHDGYRPMLFSGPWRGAVDQGRCIWTSRFPDIAREIAALDARQAKVEAVGIYRHAATATVVWPSVGGLLQGRHACWRAW